MNYTQMNIALQELISRLKDAEQGYREIYNGTSNILIKRWMKKYADERQEFQKQLDFESQKLNGDPDTKTSFLGDLHRIFIEFKLNNIDNSLEAIIVEIERGSNVLINDYNKVLELEMTDQLRMLLQSQKEKISKEINSLTLIKEQLFAEA